MKKNVIGYVRVSTSTQDLERQKFLIREFCDVNNYRLIRIISDQLSGSDGSREGYIEFISLKKEDVDVVIMTEVSRLSREEDIVQPLANINNVLKKGIDIVFLDNSINNFRYLEGGRHLSLPEVITLAVELKAADDERKKIVGRMMTGRKEKFQTFENMCIGRTPFGYKKVDNPNFIIHKNPKSFLIRDEKNARIVEEIFQEVLSGKPVIRIAKELQRREIRTNKGGLFTQGTVDTIIHNPIYKGEWKFSGTKIKGDAIISSKDWDQAQLAVKANKIESLANGSVNFNPLRGIFKCPCGHSMYIAKNGTKANPLHRQYRCGTKKNKYDVQVCSNGGVNTQYVLEAVWHAVKCSVNNREFAEQTDREIARIEQMIEQINDKIDECKNNIKTHDSELRRIADRMIEATNERLIKLLEESFNKTEESIINLQDTIEECNKEKAENQAKIDHLQETINEELNEVSEEDKAVIYKKVLQKVVYYSDVMHRGFLVVTFTNGGELIYMILSSKKPYVFQLPPSFKFNHSTRKAIVSYLDNASKNIDGSITLTFGTNEIEYDTIGIEETFPEIIQENSIYHESN